jgi:hypothetical protein
MDRLPGTIMPDQPVSDLWIGADITNMLVSLKKMLFLFPSHAHAAFQDKSKKDDGLDFSLSSSPWKQAVRGGQQTGSRRRRDLVKAGGGTTSGRPAAA